MTSRLGTGKWLTIFYSVRTSLIFSHSFVTPLTTFYTIILFLSSFLHSLLLHLNLTSSHTESYVHLFSSYAFRIPPIHLSNFPPQLLPHSSSLSSPAPPQPVYKSSPISVPTPSSSQLPFTFYFYAPDLLFVFIRLLLPFSFSSSLPPLAPISFPISHYLASNFHSFPYNFPYSPSPSCSCTVIRPQFISASPCISCWSKA